jgi:hypothetical protein
MADYLHGIQTIFMTANNDPIKILDASIAVIVGTGDDADTTKFPLNKGVLVTNADDVALLGTGTLGRAMRDIYKQGPALVIVIRVEQGSDEAELKANIIGTLDNDTGTMTGLQAVLNAEQDTGKRPRLLAVPEVQDIDVALAMESVALKYGLIPIAEADGTGFTSNNAFTTQLSHILVVAAGVKYYDPDLMDDFESGGSATALGIIIRTDNELNFATSPSNKLAYQCKGSVLPMDYTPGSTTCLANVYNSANMSVFAAQKGGTRLWGSRLANGKMIQKERVRLLVADSIRLETQDIVDGNITAPWVDNLKERTQNFVDRMSLDLIISGGKVSIPKELNIASIGLDTFYLDYAIGYYDSAEQVIYRQYTDNSFTAKVFGS